MYMSPGVAEIIVCMRSQNNLLLIYERVSNSVMFPVSHLASARLVQHWELKKEQSSLAQG